MVINEKKRAAGVVLIESQSGAFIKRKRLDLLWFSWVTEVILIEKNLADALASSWVRMTPAQGTVAPSLLQGFLWRKPLPPHPGDMGPRNAGQKQVPLKP